MATTEPFNCRWALLSLSSIARVFVPDLLLPRDPSATITHSITCVSTTRGEDEARRWLADDSIAVPDASTIPVYSSWQAMLREADFDAVYISTPHPLHYEQAQLALSCGRHVLVEKPATMTRAQYAKLVDLVQAHNVVLMEAIWTRYLPAFVHLQRHLLPRIGDVRRVYAEFSFPIVSPDLDSKSRFLDKAAGAGALLDQGVYALTWADLALHTTAPDAHTKVVFASSMPAERGGDVVAVDDMNTVILSREEYGRETAVGIVTTSMTGPGSSVPPFYVRLQAKKAAPAVRIEGTLASIAIPFPPIRPQELHIQWYGRDLVDENGLEREEVVALPVERGWGLWYQADVLVERIRARQLSKLEHGEVIGAEESLRVLGWMDRARELAGIRYDPDLERL